MPVKLRSNSVAQTAIVIMAAGKGTRLKSRHPKVLHEVGGKPLLAHVVAAALQVAARKDIYAIIGHEAQRVRDAVAEFGINFVLQQPQRGTGHALMCAGPAVKDYDSVIVLSGDAPLITPETIVKLRDFHEKKKPAMTILSTRLEDPTGYGRLIRKSRSEQVEAIVEEKSCNEKQRKLKEINSGFYAFSVPPLLANLEKLKTDNPHGEYYLTDMAAVFRKAKQRVLALPTEDPAEILGSNTRAELVELDTKLRRRKCDQLMAEGVTIFFPETCIIDSDVQVGADTVIEPFVQLLGKTSIGANCRIRSYSVIRDSQLADEVMVRNGCVLESSRVERGAILGPYCHVRPGSEIGEGAHVGNFVETKKVRLGKGSKANHLSYLGDAEIGAGVNIGAGTITCNYDGINKHKTTIEDGCFIGSDATLIAPVKVGKSAYVAAASCITEDVPADSLAIGRTQQVIKEGWARRKRETVHAAKP
jgi:bifunctional UDP-N-acetylglucosamine pyrophosphorylase/glucosamine-1-phosphate N-acetyltransferase